MPSKLLQLGSLGFFRVLKSNCLLVFSKGVELRYQPSVWSWVLLVVVIKTSNLKEMLKLLLSRSQLRSIRTLKH